MPQSLHKTKPSLFVDDTNFATSGDSITDLVAKVNSDLEKLKKWLIANKLSLHVPKQMIRNISDLQLYVKNESVNQVYESNALKVTIEQHLSWKSNTEVISKKNKIRYICS